MEELQVELALVEPWLTSLEVVKGVADFLRADWAPAAPSSYGAFSSWGIVGTNDSQGKVAQKGVAKMLFQRWLFPVEQVT